MKILVSGAAGFIGSNLLKFLQHRHEIYALDVQKVPQSDSPSLHWIQYDLSQTQKLIHLPEKIDAVIHLAQSRHYRQFPEMAEDIFQVNTSSTFHLLEYARQTGAQHFILASTGGVYQPCDEKITEETIVKPTNFYSTSKYAAELLVDSYQSFFYTTIFRLFFVYGAGQKGMLIPGLLHKVINKETIIIEGKPGLRITPTYIGDVIKAFEPALQLDSHHIINIAGDEEVSITELVHIMEEASQQAAHIEYREKAPIKRLAADNHQMKSILNINPQTTLIEGISRMIQEDFPAV